MVAQSPAITFLTERVAHHESDTRYPNSFFIERPAFRGSRLTPRRRRRRVSSEWPMFLAIGLILLVTFSTLAYIVVFVSLM